MMETLRKSNSTYDPDLSLSNFHLFPLKEFLGGKKYKFNDEDIEVGHNNRSTWSPMTSTFLKLRNCLSSGISVLNEVHSMDS